MHIIHGRIPRLMNLNKSAETEQKMRCADIAVPMATHKKKLFVINLFHKQQKSFKHSTIIAQVCGCMKKCENRRIRSRSIQTDGSVSRLQNIIHFGFEKCECATDASSKSLLQRSNLNLIHFTYMSAHG